MDSDRDEIRGQVNDTPESVSGDAQDVSQNRNVVARAREMGANLTDNPIAMLLGGLAVGFLVGLMLPVSRFESQRVRPIADDLKGRAREVGQEAMRRGSEVLKDTIEAGREAAVQAIRQQTDGMSMSESQGELSGRAGHGLEQANQNLGPGQ